jgi:hypothetical protein
VLYPRGLRHAVSRRDPGAILDAYVQLAQEACADAGFIIGSWRFRRLAQENGPRVRLAPEHLP